MYARKKKSAVPDLLGIVYCFGLNASTEPTSRLTVHILEAHVSHTPPSQEWMGLPEEGLHFGWRL